jgi:hypothetical protein
MAQSHVPEKKSHNHTAGAVEGHLLVIIRDGKFVGPVKSARRPVHVHPPAGRTKSVLMERLCDNIVPSGPDAAGDPRR